MNRIVREHYPIAVLPADLREGFADAEEAAEHIRAVHPRWD